MAESSEPHSAAYMGPERDLYWNRDQVELIGRRLGLGTVATVLDVGCGKGHWARLLDPVTAPGATTIGVDREPDWIDEATRQANAAGLGDRFAYELGTAEQLRFPDGSFDLVTCQTLLIHVADPDAVIAEMRRVARPGGVILAAEPNNRASTVVETVPIDDFGSHAALERIAFYLTCTRGKARLGEGDNSFGDRAAGAFASAGLEAIEVYLADKTWPIFPPYDTEEQRLFRSLLHRDLDAGAWLGWTRATAERLFVAGGGSAEAFETGWAARIDEVRATRDALEAGTLHTSGGGIHYVVAGRRAP